MASFVQNKKRFEILWFKKKFFLRTYVTLHPPPHPPCTQSYAFGLTPLSSHFVRTYYVDDAKR